jgi:hypothetical protein
MQKNATSIDWKSLTDCRYFINGKCTNTDCIYRHSDAARLSSTHCKYWDRYQCFYVNCAFKHGRYQEELPPPTTQELGLCKFNLRGKCTLGINCRFSHEAVNIEESKKEFSLVNLESKCDIVNPSDSCILTTESGKITTETISNKRKATDILSKYSFKTSCKNNIISQKDISKSSLNTES